MIVGELRHGQLAIIDRLRETVRLAEGLGKDGELTQAAVGRAIDGNVRPIERVRLIARIDSDARRPETCCIDAPSVRCISGRCRRVASPLRKL